MIGITLRHARGDGGWQLGKSTTAAIEDEVHADYVIDTPEGLPFRATEATRSPPWRV